MKIKWSFLAIESFDNIRDNLFEKFGEKAENDYLLAVDKALAQVQKYPNSGVIEYDLAGDGSVHSVLVNHLSKFIYYVEDDVLHIADVWDIRQKPNTLINRFEK